MAVPSLSFDKEEHRVEQSPSSARRDKRMLLREQQKYVNSAVVDVENRAEGE